MPSLHSIVELDPARSRIERDSMTLAFRVTGGVQTASYRKLSPESGFLETARSLSGLGVLEEYRYYVRKEFRSTGDSESGLSPRLSKARLAPGSEAAHHGRSSSLRLDIADGIVDLQAALGEDRDGDGLASEDRPPSGTDEWLLNSPGDADFTGGAGAPWGAARPRPLYIRLTTVGQVRRPDRRYLAPPIDLLEDREYRESDLPADAAERRQRMHRRWTLRTTVGLRNLW